MADTFKELVTSPPPDAATSYNPRFAANPTYGLTPLPKFDYSCHAGSNGFLSTPSDLVRFGMAINRGKLLRPQTVQMLQTPQAIGVGRADELRARLGAQDRDAGGSAGSGGWPQWPFLG